MIPTTKSITLGETVFEVPPLPFGVNIEAYPLCAQITDSGVIQRSNEAGGVVKVTKDEMRLFGELAFLAASCADPALTRAAFDALPIQPFQLVDAFFVIRFQTGGWVPATDAAPGEAAAA